MTIHNRSHTELLTELFTELFISVFAFCEPKHYELENTLKQKNKKKKKKKKIASKNNQETFSDRCVDLRQVIKSNLFPYFGYKCRSILHFSGQFAKL